MTTNTGLDSLGLDDRQKQMFWDFLAVVKSLKDRTSLPGTTAWTANNIITFMEGLP